MKNDTKHNGWTNYETWRVNLEIFDGMNPSDYWVMDDDNLSAYDLGLLLKDYAEDAIINSSTEGLSRDYALAFLSAVDFREIAQSMINAHVEA